MAGRVGKAAETKQRIVELLQAHLERYPGSSIESQDVARKLALHKDTAGRYMMELWKKGVLLRRKLHGGAWAYRYLRPTDTVENFRLEGDNFTRLHVYEKA